MWHFSAFLAIVHPDSTCIYYKISKGLSEPNDIAAKHSRVNKQEKLDSELRKHQNVIQQAALYGLPVTIVDKGESSKEKWSPFYKSYYNKYDKIKMNQLICDERCII